MATDVSEPGLYRARICDPPLSGLLCQATSTFPLLLAATAGSSCLVRGGGAGTSSANPADRGWPEASYCRPYTVRLWFQATKKLPPPSAATDGSSLNSVAAIVNSDPMGLPPLVNRAP